MAGPRDSTSIRASLYDVFVELGALDDNSRIAEWIFADPTYVLPDPDEVIFHRETVRFVDRQQDVPKIQVPPPRPMSPSRSFGLNFSPKRRKKSSSSSTTRSPSGDGYDTDEGYVSASQNPSPKSRSRMRRVFSQQSTKSTITESPTKPLPPLPTTSATKHRTHSITVQKATSIFRKRAKSPSADDLEQWHQVGALSPRIFNPSVDNGVPLVVPPPPPPSAFRQLVSPAESTPDSERPLSQRLSLALPRSIFHSLSVTKRRVTPRRPRPHSLHLAPDPPRFATSLPSSPFILVAEEEGATPTPGQRTPFVFVSAIDNPTPLGSAAMRRFSDVTSMTAPLYPLSIARTLRRSMVFDQPSMSPGPRLRPSSSYSSLHDLRAAGPLYDQPLRRGKEAPFPARPVLPQPLSAGESRAATIQRYREFSETLVELAPYNSGRPFNAEWR